MPGSAPFSLFWLEVLKSHLVLHPFHFPLRCLHLHKQIIPRLLSKDKLEDGNQHVFWNTLLQYTKKLLSSYQRKKLVGFPFNGFYLYWCSVNASTILSNIVKIIYLFNSTFWTIKGIKRTIDTFNSSFKKTWEFPKVFHIEYWNNLCHYRVVTLVHCAGFWGMHWAENC